ncbi:MAG: phosphate ABC transporter permease subunit PstC [Chthoniobacterales bacterium]
MDAEVVSSGASEPRRTIRNDRAGKDFFRLICWVAAVATVGVLAWIAYSIGENAWPAIQKFGLGFIIDVSWNPVKERFGAGSFLYGTAVSSFIALLIALPLGVAIAIFLSENFLPVAIRQFIRFVVEMLAAIPSVVFGLWGIFTVIPLVQKYAPAVSESLGFIPIFKGPVIGNSMFTASLVLALMVLPTITAISRTALVAVPKTLREGAYALGSTRWEAIFGVIIPTAAPGIVAATILAFGRAMGETMAVAMLIGNSPRLETSLFQPAGTLAGLLANQFSEASGLQMAALMYAALLLMGITLIVNVLGEVVLRYTQRMTLGIR